MQRLARTTLPGLLLLTVANAQQALSSSFGPTPGGGTGTAVAIGTDFDGDGTADLLVASPGIGNGVIQVVSGATNSVRTLVIPGTSAFATQVMIGVPDLDQDGRGDLVIDRNGELFAYSGATLLPRWIATGANYACAAPVGDRNGDGRGDLATINLTQPQTLRVLSGLDGSVIASYPTQLGSEGRLIALGDLNGDGVTELARLQLGGVFVLRLANPSLLTILNYGGQHLGSADLDGDGRQEVLIGSQNSNAVRAYNATTGVLLQTWNNVPQGMFAVIGDLNADGVPELALRTGASDVRFASGTADVELARWPASAQFLGELRLAGGADLNGDGTGDLLIGAPSATPNATYPAPGGWQRLSGRILATMNSRPASCAQGPFFPQLGISRPVIGQNCTVAGLFAPANTACFVAFSTQPAVPINLGVAGCDAWFDLSNGVLLAQPVGPDWQFALPVPPLPQLAGVAIALQAFYAPTQSAIGIDLSNGIWARIGW